MDQGTDERSQRQGVLQKRTLCTISTDAIRISGLYLKFHAQPPSHDPPSHGVDVVLVASGENEHASGTALEKIVKRLRNLLEEVGGRLEISND